MRCFTIDSGIFRKPALILILLLATVFVANRFFEPVNYFSESYKIDAFSKDSHSTKLGLHQGYKQQQDVFSNVILQARQKTHKFFLDCGANTGSTYKLFHDIWPNSEDYYMISFEIDSNLIPYYASFENHTGFVPLGVSNRSGSFEAYLEPPLQPGDEVPKSKWGGGSFYTFAGSKEWRNLKRAVTIPTFDLSTFISDNFREEDEVILKVDIEGAEYEVIDKMLRDGSFRYVDKFYAEFHDWQPSGWSQGQKDDLRSRMENSGIDFGHWEAEFPSVPDAVKYEPKVLEALPDRNCLTQNGNVKLAVAVGMNSRRAKRLIATVMSHPATKYINVALFVYQDFLHEHPRIVSDWLKDSRFVIGSRGASPIPQDYFLKTKLKYEIWMNVIASLRQIVKSTGQSTRHFLPDFKGNLEWNHVLKSLKMEVPVNPIWVPPRYSSMIREDYFDIPSVGKTSLLLNAVYKSFETLRGMTTTIVLDSDFDETWVMSAFLLDYLLSPQAEKAGHYLTGFEHC